MDGFTLWETNIAVGCCCDHLKFQFLRSESSEHRSPGPLLQTFLLPLFCVAGRLVVGLRRCLFVQEPQGARHAPWPLWFAHFNQRHLISILKLVEKSALTTTPPCCRPLTYLERETFRWTFRRVDGSLAVSAIWPCNVFFNSHSDPWLI